LSQTSPPVSLRRSRVYLGLTITGFTLLFLLVALETVPRFVDVPRLKPDELDPIAAVLKDSRVQPHPYLAYANRPGFKKPATEKDPVLVEHNSLGFNSAEVTWKKPAGTYRIVCLGGSSTYGFGPSSTWTNWPVKLGEELAAKSTKSIEVVNLGCQGYSTFESQINLAIRGVDLEPDLVVVYHTINDMRCALYPGVSHDNTHWRANWPVDRKLPSEQFLENFMLYKTWRRYGTDWAEERLNLGAYVIVDFGKHAPDDYAHPGDPDLGFASYRRNLINIVAIARAHGAEVLLATEACRMGDLDRFGSKELQKQGFERMTQTIKDVAKERNVPLCDSRTVLESTADRQRAESGTDKIFVRPDKKNGEVHLTDEGCLLLAQTLAARIAELGLVK